MKAETNMLAAVCGQHCEACTLYIASKEDPKLLRAFADLFQLPVDDVCCHGCRSEQRSPHCEQCKMFDCAWDRGFQFCHECLDYPCADLKLFRIESEKTKANVHSSSEVHTCNSKCDERKYFTV